MCQNCLVNIKAEGPFADRMLSLLNNAMLGLMISVGHRTGLFDTMVRVGRATSQRLADAARLNERYVREWLGAMVTGGIVAATADGREFELPEDHAKFLTTTMDGENLAVETQFISVLGSVEDEIVECFRKGGGVPYSAYRRFHPVMAEESSQTVLSALFDHILPLVPGLTEAMEEGIDVLDVGCGSGRALNMMAARFPRSRFTGYDLSPEAIAVARREAAEMGNTNVGFEIRDLSDFDVTAPAAAFDLVTAFDSVHDQARPDRMLAGIARALRRDGVFLMQDIAASSNIVGNIDHPLGPTIYTISCMHCMTVSLAQGGMGLGAAWGREKALEMLREAGFRQIEVRQLEHDVMNDYYTMIV